MYDLKTSTLITSGLTADTVLFGAKLGQSQAAPDPLKLSAVASAVGAVLFSAFGLAFGAAADAAAGRTALELGTAATQASSAFQPAFTNQAANLIYAGPATGAAAAPAFRALVLADLSFAGAANGVATLDAGGKVPTAQLPALAITETSVVASQAAMLALTAERGDVAIRTDLNKSFVLATDSPGTLADWKELLTPTDTVLSVAGLTGTISASNLKTALSLAQADISGLTTASAVAHASLALGGATPGAHALAVMGTSELSGQVTNALGTITASTPFSITQTFNNAAIGFDSLTVTQTNTASLPGSNTFFKAVQSGTTLATIGDDYLSAVGGQKAGILGLYNSLGAYVALTVRSTGTAAIETDNGSAVRAKFSFYTDGAGVAVLQGDATTGTPNRFAIQTSMPAMTFIMSSAGHYEFESYSGWGGVGSAVPIVGFETASSNGATILFSNNAQSTPVAPLGVQGVDNAADLFKVYQSTTFKGGIDKDGGYKNFYAYTDATNYEGLSLKATSATVTLAALTSGTGADNINIVLTPAGTGIVSIGSQVSIPTGSTKGLVVGSSQFFEWSANNSAIYSTGSFSFDTVSKVQLAGAAALAWLPANDITGTADLYLRRLGAGIHAWRDAANPQAGLLCATYTSATSYEALRFDAGKTTANVLRIMSEKGSGGGTLRVIAIDGFDKAGAPANTDIPAGTWALLKDTSGGGVALIYNDAGTIKSAALT